MEKWSHRCIPDLVAHPAFQGLDANEIGCVRISIMAGSNALHLKGRIQMSETSYLQIGHIQLATHGRSIQMCQLLTSRRYVRAATPAYTVAMNGAIVRPSARHESLQSESGG
jgi:hypothetical protein